MPAISVLMSVYNEEKYLHEAINSVLNQTFQDFEILIIDDFSTDRTKEIAEEFTEKDKRIKLLCHSENKKKAAAINTAIPHIKGKYTCFLDGDDLYFSDKLEKQFEFLETNPGVDMIYSNAETFDSEGNKKILDAIDFEEIGKNPRQILIEASKRQDLGKVPAWKLLDSENQGKIIPSCSVMLRSKIFEKIRADENLVTAQDYDLWFQIIGAGLKIKKLPILAYCYRIHENMITKNQEKVKTSDIYINQKLQQGKYF